MGSTESDLSVVFTDDSSIRKLNAEWRGKDKATDVLSFSQREGEGPDAFPADAFPATVPTQMLGDVVISVETAQRQAQSIGHSLDDEVARLLVHGVLHLLGYDHVHGGVQARKMKAEEERVLAILERHR